MTNRIVTKDFFEKTINIKGRTEDVDKDIDKVGKKELRKFFTKVFDMMGPNYLKMLLAQRLNLKSLILFRKY